MFKVCQNRPNIFISSLKENSFTKIQLNSQYSVQCLFYILKIASSMDHVESLLGDNIMIIINLTVTHWNVSETLLAQTFDVVHNGSCPLPHSSIMLELD